MVDIGLGFILLLLVGGLLGSRMEKAAWNKGRCRKHNRRWEHFDNDSQGGRGYACYYGLHTPSIKTHWCTTWQTYGHDKEPNGTTLPRRRNQTRSVEPRNGARHVVRS